MSNNQTRIHATLKLLYGVFAYAVSLLTISWCIGFFGNLVVPRSIDGVALVELPAALAVNLGLVLLFGLQHSGMARPAYRTWLARHIDHRLVRSSYVLASSVALLAMFVFWQPMGGVVWEVTALLPRIVINVVYFSGWALVIGATCLIDHFRLFGLRQAWAAFRGAEIRPPNFQAPGLYRHVRHPICLGWLLALWAAPVMTVTHLVFAAAMTGYLLFGIRLEERDLAAAFPEYEQYRRKVPMLLPSRRKRLSRALDQRLEEFAGK